MKNYYEPYKVGEKFKKLLTGEDVEIILPFQDMDERETDVYLVRSQSNTWSICYHDQLAKQTSEYYEFIEKYQNELAEQLIHYVAFRRDTDGTIVPQYFKTRKQYRVFNRSSVNRTPHNTPLPSANVSNKKGLVPAE